MLNAHTSTNSRPSSTKQWTFFLPSDIIAVFFPISWAESQIPDQMVTPILDAILISLFQKPNLLFIWCNSCSLSSVSELGPSSESLLPPNGGQKILWKFLSF
jgi:hypothetical protein